jgi:hypothetical protein
VISSIDFSRHRSVIAWMILRAVSALLILRRMKTLLHQMAIARQPGA